MIKCVEGGRAIRIQGRKSGAYKLRMMRKERREV